MALFDEIVKVYPELADAAEFGIGGTIMLRDDSDGRGAYIEKWEYKKPLPAGMKLGK